MTNPKTTCLHDWSEPYDQHSAPIHCIKCKRWRSDHDDETDKELRIMIGLDPEFFANQALDRAAVKRTKRPFLFPHIRQAIIDALEDDRAKR